MCVPRPACPEGRCDGSGWIKAGWERIACPACTLEEKMERLRNPDHKVLILTRKRSLLEELGEERS